MFGIGGSELILIAFVALLVFGPERIPELARTAARGYRELTKLRKQVDSTLDDVKRDLNIDHELKQLALDDAPASSTAPLIRPPQGERASARAATVAGPGQPLNSEGHSNLSAAPAERFIFAALPVPEEDDYLAPAPAPSAASPADPEDYLGAAS